MTFGYGEGIDDGHILNNYFVGGGGIGLELTGVRMVTVTGNKFYTTNSLGINIQSGEFPYIVNDNIYYAVQSSSREFGDTTVLQNLTFGNWKNATGFDSTSTATASPLPDTVFVRPNAHAAGRANIIVYTSSGVSSISVNLSPAGLTNGQPYKIRNAFNFGGTEIAAGVYNSSSPTISLPLNGISTTVATPIGATYTPPATLPQFGVFILIPSLVPGTPTSTAAPASPRAASAS